MKLKSKVVLITGGSGGIGQEVAKSFRSEGATVVVISRSKGELTDYQCDVSVPADVKKTVDAVIEEYQRIDVLVNVAGIYGPIGPSLTVDFDKWKQAFDINLYGTFYMIRNVAPHMVKQGGGKIINFSGGGDGPLPNFSAYNTSKVAVVRLTETLAVELKGDNIDINAVAPGPVVTKLFNEFLAAGEEAVGKEKYAQLVKQKEEGGVGAEKVSELCIFLASEESDRLTGKFISAIWDNWKEFPSKIDTIQGSDALTIRRIKDESRQ